MSSETTLIIVDDHDIFREGLEALITHQKLATVVGQASNGAEFIELLPILKPSMAILDIAMPEMDGITAAEKALKINPSLNILVLSMFGNQDYYTKLIQIGVKGFVLKSAVKIELENAINSVANGNNYFSNDLLKNIVFKLSEPKPATPAKENFEKLTDRELDTLQLFCKGMTTQEVADRLFLSIKTVEGHRTKLLTKTNTKNMVSLVLFAIKNEIITL